MALKFAANASEYFKFPLTIRHLLDNTLTVARHQTIHYQDRSSYTYEELFARIGKLASALQNLGVGQGTTVAVIDWDSPRYLEAFFAIPMMGAVLQTVNVRLPEAQIAYTIDHADAEVLIVHHDFYPIIEAIRSNLPKVRRILTIQDSNPGAAPDWSDGELVDLVATADAGFVFEDFDENAVATTFYTTGTTGNPKGVCFTHRQIVLQAIVTCGPFGVGAMCAGVGYQDVYMPLTPMFHVHAWGAPYLATLLGVKQVYPGRYDPELICKLRRDFRVTYSHCVPTVLQMVLDAADKAGTDLDGWRIGIGGSALSRSLYDAAVARGLQIHAGYGMTESAPTMCKSRAPVGEASEDQIIDALISCGVPAPLVSVQIVDEDMNPLPHDGEAKGELVVRSPWLTPCYVKDAEASEALWRGGWMHTQDIASINPDGVVRIRDRAKDVIKSGGEWIDSIELEHLIVGLSSVSEVSVVAVPDASWGERPLAIVVPVAGQTLTIEQLNEPIESAIAANELTRYARLDRFILVDALPRTSVGKIDKKLLRATYGLAT